MKRTNIAIILSIIAVAIVLAAFCLSPSGDKGETDTTILIADDDVVKPLSQSQYTVYCQAENEDIAKLVGILLPNATITDDMASDPDLIIVQNEEDLAPEFCKRIADKIRDDVPAIMIAAAIDSLDSTLDSTVKTSTDDPLTKGYSLVQDLICTHTMVGGCDLNTALRTSIIWAIGADSCMTTEDYIEFMSRGFNGLNC